jgi:hypothetical protein
MATTGNLVTSAETNKLCLQNRQWRHALQDQQLPTSMWTTLMGSTVLPTAHERPPNYCIEMCTAGIAMSHPAGELLAKWSQLGCPTKNGTSMVKSGHLGGSSLGPPPIIPCLQRHSFIFPKRALRRSRRAKPSWFSGTTSTRTRCPN